MERKEIPPKERIRSGSQQTVSNYPLDCSPEVGKEESHTRRMYKRYIEMYERQHTTAGDGRSAIKWAGGLAHEKLLLQWPSLDEGYSRAE